MGRSSETSGKKEIAKKKREKKVAKAEKKELRQSSSNKGKSMADMMAYVDENGNLTTQAPDIRKKKEIKAEEISLEPSGNNNQEPAVKHGIVTFFDTVKGFGFIKDADNGDNYFVHNNDLSAPVKEHDKVTFETARGPKGMKAILVKKS